MEAPRLYIGNLPYVAQRRHLEELFANRKILIKDIDISIDPFTGRNPSYCFVDFHTEEEAAYALKSIGGQDLRGRPIRVRAATAKREPVHSEPSRSTWRAQTSDKHDQNSDPYAFNRWKQFGTAETWTAPFNEDRRLYVGGLPRLPDQADANVEMRKLFKDYNVQAVSKMIYPHPSTKSKPGDHYYCFVDLATAKDAQQAELAINGKATPYGGKYRVSRSYNRPGKVTREQLGGVWPGSEQVPRERNLHGNWRRIESQVVR